MRKSRDFVATSNAGRRRSSDWIWQDNATTCKRRGRWGILAVHERVLEVADAWILHFTDRRVSSW
jgi:hypothetical protein